MIKLYAFFVATSLCFGCAVAPAAAQQVIPPSKIEFLDSTGVILPSELGAHSRRETTYADSIGGMVSAYIMDGKLSYRTTYEHIRKQIRNGPDEIFFPNGQVSYHTEYSHNKQVGEFRLYYANGQLKRRQIMDAAHAGKGECFLEDGQPTAFFKFETMPVYPEGNGGFEALIKAVMRNVNYPRDARKAKAEGRVIVSFVVTATGEVANVKLVQGVFPSLDATVLQAVKQLKSFVPGTQDGKPVAVSFTMPYLFRME
ncbi:energy transducer TonB [Hymenobacter arizonensis]|uniref:TonB family C-terminal domain-containing protein n=1 Tax=Hymenobacter arizonensis TaxID=1227077 RepID=A0A1I5TXQ1_HYMAR|nr:energy transducer TonB [Hymenobacter arizonensis]SFP87833.1 TonB family C-terminal domain-containing protein [Hymenobacter arizonensis]